MKKDLERIYVEWFVQQKGWKGCQIHDSERPDFIIDFQNKRIGMEITNLYKEEGRKGSPQKTNESLNIKWLQNVALEYYSISNIPIRIQVLKSGKQSLPEPSKIANEIVKEVPCLDFAESEVKVATTNDIKIMIFITRLPNKFNHYKRWTFINNHVGWVGEIDKKIIDKKIENKKLKSYKYNKNIDELFLLIIMDSTTASGMFILPTEHVDFSCEEFDSIYLVNHLIKIKKIG